jgi:hypothetical protein
VNNRGEFGANVPRPLSPAELVAFDAVLVDHRFGQTPFCS